MFVLSQVIISIIAYYISKLYGSRSPLGVSISVFFMATVLVVLLDHIIELYVVEILIVLIYFIGLYRGDNSSSSA